MRLQTCGKHLESRQNFSFHWKLLREVWCFLKAPCSGIYKEEVQGRVESEVPAMTWVRGEITESSAGRRRRMEECGSSVEGSRHAAERPGSDPGSGGCVCVFLCGRVCSNVAMPSFITPAGCWHGLDDTKGWCRSFFIASVPLSSSRLHSCLFLPSQAFSHACCLFFLTRAEEDSAI